MSTPQKPIFFDPRGRRRNWSNRITLGAVITLFALIIIFIVSLLTAPALPRYNYYHHAKKNHALTDYLKGKKTLQKNEDQLNWYKKWQNKWYRDHHATKQPTRHQYSAFFVNWDDSAFVSLKQNAHLLDILFPEWLHLTASGNIILDDADKQARLTLQIRKLNPKLKVIPIINNIEAGKKWNPKTVHTLVSNPQKWPLFFKTIETYLLTNHYNGLNIDFENLDPQDWPRYIQFLKSFYPRLKQKNLTLYLCIPILPEPVNYTQLSQYTDQLILMAYDQHWDNQNPGPVASADWIVKYTLKILKFVPKNKIALAIGNYGYNWTVNKTTEAVTFQEAIQLAKDSDSPIIFDKKSWNIFFKFNDEENLKHEVWFLDSTSVFNALKAVNFIGINHLSLWRMGSEDPSLWTFFGKDTSLNADMAHKLSEIKEIYDIDYEGKGEILQAVARPTTGKRNITYDTKAGVITDSHYLQYPSSYVIQRVGKRNPKLIALTFDDGPSPEYTPKILDILKREHVKATFFIVGEYANRYPKILQRIWDEGHVIGNHTYTHPNITEISNTHFRLELNTTQRLFESRLSVNTTLFRPPYAEDIEPIAPDQVESLFKSSEMGYLTVGIHIDPKDWNHPGIETIIQETLTQIENGDGNVVLLHDGGGERSQTIAALPHIIQELRKKGYSFGTIADLLGKTRDKIMIPIASKDKVGILISGLALWGIHWLIIFTFYAFFTTVIIGVIRATLLSILALVEARKEKPEFAHYTPKLSVIIPAYNEEKVIERTIHSVLHSLYPSHEVLVINDGSTDQTASIVSHAFNHHPQVTLITKHNSGKSNSINVGLAHATGEIIIVLDADTLLDPNALFYLARHFQDPKIAAVSGNAKVGNRLNILTKCQSLEYISSQNLDRRAYANLNCITVVPGAIGAWRKSVLVTLGGFSEETLAEDTDLTILALKEGWKVTYEEKGIAYTEAPQTFSSFAKQRFRWTFGNLQVLYKYRHIILNPKYKWLGILALPNMLLFQIIFPLLTPVLEFSIIIYGIGLVIDILSHNGHFYSTDFFRILIYYSLFMSIDFVMCLLAFSFEPEEPKSQLKWFIVQRLIYRPLMIFLSLRSLTAALKGHLVGWNKFSRTGINTSKGT